MTLTRFATMLSFAACLGPFAATAAESEKGDAGAAPVSQGAASLDVYDQPDEIVVTAARYGEAKVAAESELDEGEIASHGADSILELLTRLAPLINSGDEPVILINGKPAGFDLSILSYPAEALDRLAVLKPEAASQYGGASGKRVVNLVLKKNFSMLNADAGVQFATGGGQYGGNLSVARTAISGPVRWNVNARIGRDSGLRKDARNIPGSPGVFDSVGFVSRAGGGEIDPALSDAAGGQVIVAAIPSRALSGHPTLADFAETANDTHAVDPHGFETFQSSRRNMLLSIGATRPLGAFSASLNLNASRNSSSGQRGLPMASVVLPAGSAWSPFASDIILTRPFDGERALRSDNMSESLGGSLSLNGMIGGWQTSFGINYSRNWGDSRLESGVDVELVQQRIDLGDPDFNPYGAWDEGMLRSTRNRTRGDNLSGRVQAQNNIAELPAGPLTMNISMNASRGRTESRRSGNRDGLADVTKFTREQVDGQLSMSVPISRRGVGQVGPLGDLIVDLSLSGQTMTKSALQKQFGGGVNWSPIPLLQLRGSLDYVETAPTFIQLDSPVVTTVNRVFDYVRGEIAEPVWITGGNPDLQRGNRRSLAVSVTIRPFDDQTLSLTTGYRQTVAKGAVASFPELTPSIEAAFPERVTRGADGRLIAVDARAINLARQTDASLSSGLVLRLPGQGGAGRGKGADPLQFSVSFNHAMLLKSELLTHPGVPVIDQLAGGGQSRHTLSLQITAGKRGVGASLNGSWGSATRVSNADRVFRFKPPMIFNLAIFVEPGSLFGRVPASALTKDLKISLDIQNLFNGYRRVLLEDGSAPPGYSRNEIDPLGRTARLTLRKKF